MAWMNKVLRTSCAALGPRYSDMGGILPAVVLYTLDLFI